MSDDDRPEGDELDDEPLPGLDDEPLPGVDDPENEPSSSQGDPAPPSGDQGPYATVEEALRIPERSDDDARPEPDSTPRRATGPTTKRSRWPPRRRKTPRGRKVSKAARARDGFGLTYEDQVRDAENAIAVPGREGAADVRHPPAAESRTHRRLIIAGGVVGLGATIAIGAVILARGDDDSSASESRASEDSEPAADPTPAESTGGEASSVKGAVVPTDLLDSINVGTNSNNRGYELDNQDPPDPVAADEQYAQARDSYQAAIDTYAGVEDAAIAALVADAYNGRGFALENLDQPAEAMASYQATEDNYGSRPEPEIQSAVGFAMYSRATLLAAEGQTDAAKALFQTVIDLYSQAEDEGVRLWADLASSSLDLL